MKKASKIAVIIACVAVLVCVFASTVSAANTGTGSARFYRPIMNVASVGNYSSVRDYNVTNIYEGVYSYASVFNPPTDVLLPLEMFSNKGLEYYLTNTINWSGLYNPNFNGGVHQSTTTTRFYNTSVPQSDTLIARSETALNGMAGNSDVVVFLNESIWTSEYFEAMKNGKRVFDGIRLSAQNYEDMAGTRIVTTWSQYEPVENGVPRLVRHTTTRYITDFNPYEERINGTTYEVIAIPYFDWENLEMREILNLQEDSYNDKSQRLFYVQDVEIRFEQNGVERIDMFSTYDQVNEISASVGGYLKNANIVIDFDSISWTDWLANSVGSFMNFELIPGLSLSVIFLGVLGVLAVKAFLNAFAGG